jgi:hypothetical protein
MSKRNPLSVWIVVSIFLASITAVPLTCRFLSRPAPPPAFTELRTVTELVELLSQDAPDLHVIPLATNGELEFGIFVCNQSHSLERLMRLPRTPDAADRWHGVVCCTRSSLARPENRDLIDEFVFQDWGDHGMRIEPFLFFGDPDLLRRINQIIRNHSKG